MKKIILVLAALMLLIPQISLAKLKAPDVLDTEKIMTDDSLSKYKTVGIKIFTTDDVEYSNVDDDEKKNMKRFLKDAQEKLAKTIKNNLEDDGIHAVILDDEKGNGNADLIIEGRFKEVNLGNAVMRFGWGFGAG